MAGAIVSRPTDLSNGDAMAELRLTGLRLAMLRRLASTPVASGAIWAAVSGDFKVPQLKRLPPEFRLPIDSTPQPVQAAPPRTWDDAALAPAEPRRCIGRQLRVA